MKLYNVNSIRIFKNPNQDSQDFRYVTFFYGVVSNHFRGVKSGNTVSDDFYPVHPTDVIYAETSLIP